MTQRPNPYDQVGTVDTTHGGVDISTAIPPEPPEEGEEEVEEQKAPEGQAVEEEATSGESGGEAGEAEPEATSEAAPEEQVEELPAIPEPGEAEPAPEEEPPVESAYDPGDHSVAEVTEYIQLHPEEKEAILEAERQGKARVTILNL